MTVGGASVTLVWVTLGVGMIPEHFASHKFVMFLKKILIHLFPQGMHIIGDSAYPLLGPYLWGLIETMATCLLGKDILTESSIAFGILKSKFRRLHYLQMRSISNISSAVSACCILHNLCLEPSDQVVVVGDGVDDEPYPQQPHNTNACHYAW